MNIVDAIKSGKRFKLNEADWIDNRETNYCFNRKEFLSECWEIEEKKIELSWEQIRRAIGLNTNSCAQPGDRIHDFDKIKKDLGFE